MNLELFILKDYANLIDNLPDNITLTIVDNIDPNIIFTNNIDAI